MEEKIISIISPDGKVSTVEYVTELIVDGNRYLAYNDDFEENKPEVEISIVKLVSDGYEYMVDEIKEDAEYAKVSKALDELISGEGV